MARRERYVVGLDVGTSKIAAIVGEMMDDGTLDIIGIGREQADADAGVLALPGSVDDAAHHGDLELFHSRMLRSPLGKAQFQIPLDLLGHLLEEGARRPAATGTRGDLG